MGSDNTENRDPLEVVHDIQRVACQTESMIRAMRILGMNDGADDLAYIQETISHLAKEAAAGIMRESHDLLMDGQRRTGEMVGAILESCLAQSESH